MMIRDDDDYYQSAATAQTATAAKHARVLRMTRIAPARLHSNKSAHAHRRTTFPSIPSIWQALAALSYSSGETHVSFLNLLFPSPSTP